MSLLIEGDEKPKAKLKNNEIYTIIFLGKVKHKIVVSEIDAVYIIIFIFVGLFSRFFRIQYPRECVFDEVHFGNFTNFYIKKQYYNDIHPPFAKMIIALMAHVWHYKGDYDFEKLLSNSLNYPNLDYISLRTTPAFFAGMCPVLAYIALRLTGASYTVSVLVGICITSDINMIVEGRFILTDGILHFFSILAVITIILDDHYNTIISYIIMSICIGLACSIKFTAGGVALLYVVKEFIYALTNTKYKRSFLLTQAYIRSCFTAFIAGFVMLFLTCVHLEILPYEPDDNTTFLPITINGSLVNKSNPDWEKRHNAWPLPIRAFDLLIQQLASNGGDMPKHPYSSRWYQWPLLTGKWVLFYARDGRRICCMGSPLLYYPVFASVIISFFYLLYTKKWNSKIGFMFYGYVTSLLPFAIIPREMFLYHYVIALVFGVWNMALLIDILSPRLKGFITPLIGVSVIVGYFLFAPFAYGLEELDFDFITLNNNWR